MGLSTLLLKQISWVTRPKVDTTGGTPRHLERGTAEASEMRVLDEVQVRRTQVKLRPLPPSSSFEVARAEYSPGNKGPRGRLRSHAGGTCWV
jgi:hypothetical protein